MYFQFFYFLFFCNNSFFFPNLSDVTRLCPCGKIPGGGSALLDNVGGGDGGDGGSISGSNSGSNNPIATHFTLIGEPGQSCNTVCKIQHKKCDVDMLDEMNDCKTMQNKFGCSTCDENEGNDQPCMNEEGVCMIKSNRNEYSCTGTYPTTRRICSCF